MFPQETSSSLKVTTASNVKKKGERKDLRMCLEETEPHNDVTTNAKIFLEITLLCLKSLLTLIGRIHMI